MTTVQIPTPAQAAATTAWSRRVRRVGGFIQVAFAAFWLLRGSLTVHKSVGLVLALVFGACVIAVIAYGVRVTGGQAPRPTSPEGKHIERAVTVATVLQLAASFAVPVAVSAAGSPDWALPSIAITIGPLLLWLGRRVNIARYGPVGWALIVGPIALGLTMSGRSLAATTGIAAGAVLLGTAALGFHDLVGNTVFGLPRARRLAAQPR